MTQLKIPGLYVRKNNENEWYNKTRYSRDAIYVNNCEVVGKIGTWDDVTLNYAYEWNVDNSYNPPAISRKTKVIVYKFLSEEQITTIFNKSLNDFNKCLKQVEIWNKKHELEKDF